MAGALLRRDVVVLINGAGKMAVLSMYGVSSEAIYLWDYRQ